MRAASHLSDETACLRPAGGGIVARLAAVALCLLSTPLPTNAQETTRTLLPAPVIPVPASIDRADVDVGVAALDGIVSEAMQATGVPGVAVAIVYQDDVIFVPLETESGSPTAYVGLCSYFVRHPHFILY